MAQVRQHVNARLTQRQRREMVEVMIVEGWGVAAAAQRFQVSAKTARKWRDRYVAEGPGGLADRSSRPRRSPGRSSPEVRAEVVRLRRCRRRGAAWIAHEVALAPSTVQKILTEAGLGRLDRGDRATAEAPVRYQRERPGELVHVDIKKLPAIPPGGGWRVHGRGQAPTPGAKAGYRYLHTALDDRTRLAYSEHLDDERGETAAAFWSRANAWFGELAITCERVITDNGGCYRSRAWHKACKRTRTKVKKTRPYRPQTNGKVERFHRTLLEEWAYIRPWTCCASDQRATTPRRLPGIPPLLQSPPSPRRARLENTRHHHREQPPRHAHLGSGRCGPRDARHRSSCGLREPSTWPRRRRVHPRWRRGVHRCDMR